MKKLASIIILTGLVSSATAEYIITIPLESGSISITSDWKDSATEYGKWNNAGEIYGCSNWSPLTSSITIGQTFTQTATDCSQNQVRTAQDKEIEKISGITKNKGPSYIETQTITVSDTREAVGSLETWVETTPTYTAWVNSGAISGCTNWSPETSTVTIGQLFTQTATDCEQTQVRSKQNREIETTTNQIRDVGTPVSESQVVTVSSTRNVTGTKETWVAITPTYTNWVNNGNVTGCSNWSPDTSTKPKGESFTQKATDCSQPQTRSRQEREQETTTLAIRNNGAAVTETQTITVSSTRPAIGTKADFEYVAGKTFAACNGPVPPNRVFYSIISYNGVFIMQTTALGCLVKTGSVINGYEVGPSVSANQFKVKKL